MIPGPSESPPSLLERVLIWDDDELVYVARGPDAPTPQRARELAAAWWRHCTSDLVDVDRVLVRGHLDLVRCQPGAPSELRPCWPGEDGPDVRVWVVDVRPAIRA
jgi:hypothetical protein